MPEEEFDTDSDRHLADEANKLEFVDEAAPITDAAIDSLLSDMEAEMLVDQAHGFTFTEWNAVHQLLVQTQHGLINQKKSIGLTDLKQSAQLSVFIEQVTSTITKVAYWGNKALAVHQDKINELIKDIKTPIVPLVRK